jgi:putative transcriptional regulator
MMEEMYGAASELRKGGFIDIRRVKENEALYWANQVPKFTGESVKALRKRLNVSQTVLAIIINTSAATARSWEAGTKKPGGPTCKLLDILDRKGLDALL